MENQINELLDSSKIFLFMKGQKEMPMCRFSAAVVSMLNQSGVDYSTFNILEDMEMREAVKEYAKWPTYPQLWVNKEFVGGCDIITELFDRGELEATLKQ